MIEVVLLAIALAMDAFTAAISMVDYVTQPYPIDAPQNPHHHD